MKRSTGYINDKGHQNIVFTILAFLQGILVPSQSNAGGQLFSRTS